MAELECSHQFAFRLAVVELLRSDARFADVRVSAFPVDLETLGAQAWIELIDTRMTSQWDLLGAKSTAEEFVLDGRLGVFLAGNSPEQHQAVIERADELATALQRLIRANYKMTMMDGAIRDCILVTLDTSPFNTDKVAALFVPFQIRVNSQLRYV